MKGTAVYRWFVRSVWARHNRSAAVRRALDPLLTRLSENKRPGLNVGCGSTNLHERMIRFDLDRSERPDTAGSATALPFLDNSFSLAVSQEVLEHLPDPQAALAELARVIEPGGTLYVQTPFIIGYHATPSDYWRFTNDGLSTMLRDVGLRVERLEPAVGAATGLYRVAVEFCGVAASRVFAPAYLWGKAAAALLFAPLRWLDPWLSTGPERWRIAGGSLAVARKAR